MIYLIFFSSLSEVEITKFMNSQNASRSELLLGNMLFLDNTFLTEKDVANIFFRMKRL